MSPPGVLILAIASQKCVQKGVVIIVLTRFWHVFTVNTVSTLPRIGRVATAEVITQRRSTFPGVQERFQAPASTGTPLLTGSGVSR